MEWSLNLTDSEWFCFHKERKIGATTFLYFLLYSARSWGFCVLFFPDMLLCPQFGATFLLPYRLSLPVQHPSLGSQSQNLHGYRAKAGILSLCTSTVPWSACLPSLSSSNREFQRGVCLATVFLWTPWSFWDKHTAIKCVVPCETVDIILCKCSWVWD